VRKLLIYHRRAEELRALIAPHADGLEIAAGFDDATLHRHLADADALLAFKFPVEALPRAARLRWIQLTSAGAEQLLPARAGLGDVTVTNTRGIHVELMADYALGVMVMLNMHFPRFFADQQARRWEQRLSVPLAGRTLAVVGAGAIGGEIARRAAAFGMRVLAVKRTPGPVEGAEVVVGAEGLAAVLPRADFVVLVVPVTAATRGLIGEAELRAMRPTAYLVNIARGSVVEEAPLVRALREGWIAGAALDVFDEEPLPPDSPLWDLPNAVLTPHVAGEPADYARRVADVFVDNLARLRRGEPLRNVVDFERGY
jgi:phosphoglycerate dehydrogenase-like enzyme